MTDILAEFDMDPMHGPIVRVRVNRRWVSVYLNTENGVVTEPSGAQYGIEIKGPWWKLRRQYWDTSALRVAIRALLDCPDIADNDHKDVETHAAERLARAALSLPEKDCA